MLPFLDNPDRKSLHTLWSREIYRFLRDFFSTVAMGPATEYDELGNPEITKQEGTGVGWVIPYTDWHYSGMFAILDETDYDAVPFTGYKVRVTAGLAYVNGAENSLAATVDEFTGTGERVYYLLAATEDDGNGTAVFVGTPLAGVNQYTNTPAGYTVGTRLRLGSVSVSGGRLTVTQDYLAGSSNQLVLAERCP